MTAMRKFTCFLSLALSAGASLHAAQFQIGAHNFTLPDGFQIELVAGTNLAPRPIEADFDEQGRLYVTDSSGSNDKPDKQLIDKPHRIVRLEDTDGDGRFDKSIIFADKMSFLEGCMWLDGSLYVAAPPSIWKLTDTNNDGVADVRVEWFQGKTLTGCANDLHGPYAGPDGWIYWCKGAFAKQTYTLPNGKEFTTRASHIFRARPDGTSVEPVMTGGMDNPVGLVFTPEGQRILSGTFFQNPEGGKRDGLIHALYGGVYGKVNDVLEGHTRTGDLLPMMTHLGPAAPVGLVFYESPHLDDDLKNNLFVCNFNLHKITRHVLKQNGATFKTVDSDFLVSENTDFHPTDVLEDADGSLIVVDTGGWYKLCCPTSQLYKPDVLGGIYRIRRTAWSNVKDPRGLNIEWTKLNATEQVKFFDDHRPVVVKRAIHELVAGQNESVPVLRQTLKANSEAQRRNAVWALTQIDGKKAREAIEEMFSNGKKSGMQSDDSAARAAIYSIGFWRDKDAVNDPAGTMWSTQIAISDATGSSNPATRRMAAETLGRSGAKELGVRYLLRMAEIGSLDRSLEHSIIYALIELDNPAKTSAALDSANAQARRIALIALDQMPDGQLKPEQVIPLLSSTDAILKDTASWIIERHADWGASLAAFFGERLNAQGLADTERGELQPQLARLARSPAIQELLVKTISNGRRAAQVVALRALARTGVKEMPADWVAPLIASLQQKDSTVLVAAIATVRALPVPKANEAALSTALIELAERTDVPSTIRIAAAATVPGGIRQLSEPLYNSLLAALVTDGSVAERADAANALARARFSNSRLLEVAAYTKRVGPMELPRLLPAFAQSTNEAVGLKLIDSLQASKAVQSVRAETLKPAITNFPASVQQRADELLASINTDAAQQKKHIDEMLASARDGDIRRGQAIFNSPKAACSACHAIGYLGGNVGPDLTRIGQIRNERDLLEAIVYPSASFVRSYEPVIVSAKSGDEFSGVLRKDSADEIVLATGPNTEQRIPRGDISEMRPGTVSVMPSGLAEQLSKQEVADLLAFLKATRW
jgi:putative membrane-bound dehydrogenase-like protein